MQFSEVPSGAYTDCPAVPEIVTDAPTAPLTAAAMFGSGSLSYPGSTTQRLAPVTCARACASVCACVLICTFPKNCREMD